MTKTKLIPYNVTQIDIDRLPGMPERILPWEMSGRRHVLVHVGGQLEFMVQRLWRSNSEQIIMTFTSNSTFFMGRALNAWEPWWYAKLPKVQGNLPT